jgi:hypothetical protein
MRRGATLTRWSVRSRAFKFTRRWVCIDLDTPSDAEAARKVGIPAIGLLTGGFRRCDLKAGGCRAVFDDLGALGRALKSVVS